MIQKQFVPVHILAHDMENAVNVLLITAGTERSPDASFPKLLKKHMIDQLKISTPITKRIAELLLISPIFYSK